MKDRHAADRAESTSGAGRITPYPFIDELPAHLAERVEVLADRPFRPDRLVLYWTHHAIRAEENPALEVALHLARRLDAPMLVYQGFSGRHPHSNDRHLRFALEGARDLQRALRPLGIPFAFHLPAHPAERSPLRILVREAACLVTEEFPAQPFARWSRGLVRTTRAPVLAVDTSCILPMRLVGRAIAEIDRFREETAVDRTRRIGRPWPNERPAGPWRAPRRLPFQPLELEEADLTALIAGCDIDHEVPPAPSTRGGGTAGLTRWNRTRRDHLEIEPGQSAGPPICSRLSPYLHYGMVSPFRIARELHGIDAPAAAALLDRLAVLREHAYVYCRFRPDHDTIMSLAGRIRSSLHRHQRDTRDRQPSWESLIRARTGDTDWDGCQRQLLIEGTLADLERLAWGKRLIAWTADAAEAFSLLLDLNHRFALDGSDPCSYVGALRCLGQFEQPAAIERPVYGRVRPPEFGPRRAAPLPDAPPDAPRGARIAVIGAGIAGLAAARQLADQDLAVTVFEQNEAPGGRAAGQPAKAGRFDPGLPWFTVTRERFRRHVRSWCHERLAAPISPHTVTLTRGGELISSARPERFGGTPGIDALVRHLAQGLDLRLSVAVHQVTRQPDGWRIVPSKGLNGITRTTPATAIDLFDLLVVALPAPAARAILGDADPLAEILDSIVMEPCWTVLLEFDRSLELDFDEADTSEPPLSRLTRRQPVGAGDMPGEGWLLEADAAWSARHLEDPEEAVSARLEAALAEAVGRPLPEPIRAAACLRRHAAARAALGRGCLWRPDRAIAVCDDWCLGRGVEAAYLSGVAAAGCLLGAVCDLRGADPKPI